ncbi:MAG: nuclear transport factor 2 family protein [Proteobacteria bacterium]|nr:nuclear transport factor 2 family protein [Pseudomonadota bacterium]
MTLRLEDIELIRRLKYRYWRCLDTGDIAGLRDVFTDDITVDYIGGSYRWQIAGREQVLQSIAGSFNANSVACHTGHHPEIDVQTETTASGIWYLTDVFINLAEKLRTTGSALYRDKYLKAGGQWRIAESVYERLYEEVEPYTGAAKLTAHWLARVPPPGARKHG